MNAMAAVPANDHAGSTQNLGWAWVLLALALAAACNRRGNNRISGDL